MPIHEINKDSDSTNSRRKFIRQVGMATAGIATLSNLPEFVNAQPAARKDYTVQEVIDILIKPVAGAPFPQTVDTVKSGSPTQRVTGIVTTMFATVSVIEETAKLGANFIIAHEPTFYNHTDDKNWAGPNNTVRLKEELLNKHGIAVWRFHDYIHSYNPDGVRIGVLRSLGWEKNYKEDEMVVELPAISLSKLIRHIKVSLGIKEVRVIGDPNQSCKRIALIPGAAGGQAHIRMIEKTKPDVFLCGEIHEWETGEYVHDSRLFGKQVALVLLGHAQSEEPGMKWLAEELPKKLDGVKVTHIPSGSPFIFM